MAKRHRAAVDVDLVGIDVEQLDRVQRDRAERLVDLDHVHVVERQARLFERRSGRTRRGAHQIGVVVGDVAARRAPPPVACARAQPPSRSSASTMAAPPSFTLGAFPAVVAPSLVNTGGSFASCSAEVSRRGPSSMLDHRLALAARDRDRHDLLAQLARVDGRHRPLVAAQRPRVLRLPADPDLGADVGVLSRHDLAVEGAGEPVVGHRVDQHAVAHRVPEPRLGHQVRRVGHALHATREHNLVLPRPDVDVSHRGRAHARGTHLVDRLRTGRLGQPYARRHLARRDLAGTRLQHLAHHHVVDLVGRHARTLQRGRGRMRAQLRPGQRCQPPAEAAERGAGRTDDDGSCHT